MQTRKGLLKSVGAMAATLAVAEDVSAGHAIQLGRRFGRTHPPRLSMSLPSTWFLTEKLTDVWDPIQLFAVANRVIPAPHANVHGVVNPRLIPRDAVLATGHAFVLTSDMHVYGERGSTLPPTVRLAEMPGTPFGDMGLTTHTWSHTGQKFGVQIFVWLGTGASESDVGLLDGVLGSLTFDEPL